MPVDDWRSIVDFAIQRELEAVEFYRRLEAHTRFSDKKRMLRDLERMERRHAQALERLRDQVPGDTAAPADAQAQDLHLSDYLVPPPERGELSYGDILVVAMKKEETSHRLYTELAGRQRDETLRNLFLRLAAEESGHKRLFEELYDQDILTQG
ncbi:MAG: ferritin family protein [Spirochaetota bacterium]